MQLHARALAVCLFLAGAFTTSGWADDNLKDVLARMNQAASEFKSMTAHVTYVTHTDVLNEDNTETGNVVMKKVQPGEVQVRIDFTAPDVKTVIVDMRRFRVYYPKIKTVQVYDLAKHGEQFDQLVMTGFGTSGTELAKDYDMKVLGTEPLKSQEGMPAIRVELTPKRSETRQYVKTMVLWIPEQGDPYPLQEKIVEPSGDYRLVTYSGLKINSPLAGDAMQLKLPAGVKTEYPGK
ncbi:MAG TPA: outer membrane lipoprotein carrier protein LolA [Bryobacteraceae bacterium]|nr:outer membrane lipoprotein carrier protein LolA [Bryobacteraceae bacterium]